jgi:hypothetical protein
MIATHTIQDIVIDQLTIQLIIDGRLIKVPLDIVSKKLLSANELERNLYKISPSGYGIHWPLIDEDLSVEALIKVADQ